MDVWETLLNQEIERTSKAAVGKRCKRANGRGHYDRATVHLISKGTYPANSGGFWDAFKRAYGNGLAQCPALGQIEIGECVTHYRLRKSRFDCKNAIKRKMAYACAGCAWRAGKNL